MLEDISNYFTYAFIVELVLRRSAHRSFDEYVADPWNVFDAVVVGSSVIELVGTQLFHWSVHANTSFLAPLAAALSYTPCSSGAGRGRE